MIISHIKFISYINRHRHHHKHGKSTLIHLPSFASLLLDITLLSMEMRRLTIALDVCALWLLLLVVACRLEVTTAGSGGGAHPHQGVVQPFRAGDPGIKIDKAAEKLLDQGKPYQTQIQSGSAGRGLVVQDVAAPTQVVWDRILDFNSYSKMVPKTMESQIYKREKAGRGGAERIWVRMKVGFTPAPRLTFFVNHLYQPQLNSMTWTLDYSRKSDFDDSCGYWYVLPHPQNKEWTRVYYSVEGTCLDGLLNYFVKMTTLSLTLPIICHGNYCRCRCLLSQHVFVGTQICRRLHEQTGLDGCGTYMSESSDCNLIVVDFFQTVLHCVSFFNRHSYTMYQRCDGRLVG